MARFRWNAWNIEHIGLHGVMPVEAEMAVAASQDRRRIGVGKYKAVGRGNAGRWLQVIYIFDPPGVIYVIHARPLNDAEKRQARRRTR
jgi:uncharacterized DUF497 family protein